MRETMPAVAGRLFFEKHPDHPLARRALAEGTGTAMLVLVVAGSGLALQGSGPAGLLAGAVAIGSALAALVATFGPVSGGHFNPLITFLQWLTRERKTDCLLAYLLAQCIGAMAGVSCANHIFAATLPAPAQPVVASAWLPSEFLASTGLLIVVRLVSRRDRPEGGPFAVGAWLAAAIVATPTHSLANPALALAALMANGPLSASPQAILRYLPIEFLGALTALALAKLLLPGDAPPTGRA